MVSFIPWSVKGLVGFLVRSAFWNGRFFTWSGFFRSAYSSRLFTVGLLRSAYWYTPKSVTDPLIIPHRSRLSSAELPVLGGPQRSLLIDGANPYHFRIIQCFVFTRARSYVKLSRWLIQTVSINKPTSKSRPPISRPQKADQNKPTKPNCRPTFYRPFYIAGQ
jgi:hypothetical protein